jgi:hypothetical protein
MSSWWDRRDQLERVVIAVAAAQIIFFWIIFPILIETCIDHSLTYGRGALSNFKPLYSLLHLFFVFGPLLLSAYYLAKRRWKLAWLGVGLCLLGIFSALMNAGRAFQANKSTCTGFKAISSQLEKL